METRWPVSAVLSDEKVMKRGSDKKLNLTLKPAYSRKLDLIKKKRIENAQYFCQST